MRKLSVRVDGIDGMLLGPLDALGDDLHVMTRLYLTLAYAQFAAEHELIEAVRLPTDKPGVSTIAIRVRPEIIEALKRQAPLIDRMVRTLAERLPTANERRASHAN